MRPLSLLPLLSLLASPVGASTFDDHYHLYNTLQSVGVIVSINSHECAERPGVDGFYNSRTRALHVCQDNMNIKNQEVEWTSNDFNTLRHEAWHTAQDCNGNGIGNGYLVPVMDVDYAYAVLGKSQAERMMNNPAYRGADRHIHLAEMEAFAVAERESARSIADKLLQCYHF